jgi:long-chain acyl-CoA synthetase
MHPGRPVIRDQGRDGRSLDYAALDQRVRALGGALSGLGVTPGERVGFLGANSLAHLEVWLAVPAFGRVLVDLNVRLSEDELAFMVDDCELSVLIVDDERLYLGRELRARCPALTRLVLDSSDPEPPSDLVSYEELVALPPDPWPEVDENSLAAISYTGGTTGRPKGVMLSHRNLLANAQHNLMTTGHRTEDRWLHVCPMFHVAGTANVLACTWVGAYQVILPRFAARPVIDTISKCGITHTVLVPTMLGMLLDELAETGDELASLRHVQYAASPIAPALQARVLDRLACDVAQFYGMTEAAPTVTHLTPADHRRGQAGEEPYAARLRSTGAPVVGVEAEAHDPEGRRCPPGAVGEICVRGPNVMLGYWRRPEATAEVMRNGWYRSGDAAYADADGYLYLVDRLKDMIISGGENVYSIEVEAVLEAHPAVGEAAVFGVPDPRWGEAVHAVVAVADATTVQETELIDHCRSTIAGYKVPRRIELQSTPLPRSAAGKLLKGQLRDPHWRGHDRQVS